MALIDNTKTNYGKLGYYPVKLEDENTGVVKYYARLAPYSKKEKEDINAWAAQFKKVSEASMKVAFEALAEAIQYFTLNGHSVSLEGLGSFGLSCKSGVWDEKNQKWKSAGKTSASDVNSTDIRSVHVRFRTGALLREKMKSCRLFDVTKSPFGQQFLGMANV